MRNFILNIIIYIVLLGLVIFSIVDAPHPSLDTFSVGVISWLLYSTIKNEFAIKSLKDEIEKNKKE